MTVSSIKLKKLKGKKKETKFNPKSIFQCQLLKDQVIVHWRPNIESQISNHIYEQQHLSFIETKTRNQRIVAPLIRMK